MKFTLKGRLQTAICDENELNLLHTKIRVYSFNEGQDAVAAFTSAQSKEISQVFESDEIKKRAGQLLAESKTDAHGNYEITIDAEQSKYSGGALAVTLYYDEVTDYGQKNTKLPKGFKPFEIVLDIMQPKWRETNEGLFAKWNYSVLRKVWCYILKRLDIWVICGTLTNCESQQPLQGIEVIAMDNDIITDDFLGSQVTDFNGRFCIFYRSIDFKKTFLSPFINIETTPIFSFDNGPDVYFKFAVGGVEFFAENPSEGLKPSRKNVGNCLCVRLCLKESPAIPGDIPAAFYEIGYARKYHPVLNINPTTGLTTGKAETNLNNQAFYSTIELRGSLTKLHNDNPLEYKFQYAKVADPNTDISSIASWTDVEPGQIAKTVIATRLTSLFPLIRHDSYVIHGNNSPTPSGNEIRVEFNGNWIQSPQYSGGGFDLFFNGALIKLITNQLNGGTVDKTGLIQGTSSAPLLQNDYYALRMVKREAGNPSTEVVSGFSRPLALFNTIYENVPQGGSWLPTTSNEMGIACLDLQELSVGGGCSKVDTTLSVNYTAANPNLGAVNLSMTGPDGPHTFEPIQFPTPGEEAFGSSDYIGDVSSLKKCAYIVEITAALRLTNGETQHQGIKDRLSFCK